MKEVAAGDGPCCAPCSGFVIGVLPGAGATIASAMSYAMESRMAGKDHQFGNGDLRGVAAPEAANNASASGSLVPMLTLGVPGSGTTAVMIGALTLYNITPGPLLFQDQPEIVWGLIASLFIANVMLLVLNIPLIRVFVKFLSIPNWLLVPGVAAISLVGVYAVHGTTFDLILGTLIGGVGYLLRVMNFPIAPFILGFVLGDMMEQNLRRALSISDGDVGVLFASPISIGLWVVALGDAGGAAPDAHARSAAQGGDRLIAKIKARDSGILLPMTGIPRYGGPIPARRLRSAPQGAHFFGALELRSARRLRGSCGANHSAAGRHEDVACGLRRRLLDAGSRGSASETDVSASTRQAPRAIPGCACLSRENLALADRSEAVAHAGHHHLVLCHPRPGSVADRVVGAALVVELRVAGVQRGALGQRVQVVGRPAVGVLARGAVGFVALGVADAPPCSPGSGGSRR